MLFCVTKVVIGWILNLSMEGEEENCRKRKGKFRSCWRKKRKGFHGKKAWEMRRERSTDVNHDAIEELCKELQPSTSKGKSEYDDFLDRTAPKNMSELKLRNSSFNDLEDEGRISTCSQSSSSGMPQSMEEHEKAHGFKLPDAELLSQCISKSAICSSCKNPKSQLQLFQENSNRDGLAELLYLKCSSCDCITPLQTSKRLGGKGGGAHEVNRRSVLSSHHGAVLVWQSFVLVWTFHLQLPRKHTTST